MGATQLSAERSFVRSDTRNASLMSREITPCGRLARKFVAAYHRSLSDYRLFFDDISEIGDPDLAAHAFYYVPGINGSAGQMRFALPSLTRTFGPRIYVKALSAPDFSSRAPVWDKYTIPNTERKLTRLRADLASLLRRFEQFVVVCSSNGMYDFLAAAAAFAPGELESRIHLVWIACAPDQYAPTIWQRVFFPLNGIEAHGHTWFAYPNHEVLRGLNPETGNFLPWHEGHQQRKFDRLDLASRFHCLGLRWDYISTSQLGEVAQYVGARIHRPWAGPVDTLIAADDGYWQGASYDAVLNVIRRYVPEARCVIRSGSHAGVVTPTNLTELFGRTLASMRPGQWARRSSRFARADGFAAMRTT